jgi:hypothetical protein
VSFLGKARRFLIPHKILKPAPGLLGGLVDCSFTPSFTLILTHPLAHWFMRSFTFSLIHSSHPYLSLIDPSSSACLGLGKGNELLKSSHGIVGCSGRWCNPAMT